MTENKDSVLQFTHSGRVMKENGDNVNIAEKLERIGNSVTIIVTIASGATGISAAVDLTGIQIQQLIMPATWVTADLTLQTSDAELGTYQDLYDDSGSEVVLKAVQAKNMSVVNNALALAPLGWTKFRSGTSAVPVNQTASRTIKIIGKI